MRARASILFLWALTASAAPLEYASNADLRTVVQLQGDQANFAFGFRDTRGALAEWSWSDRLRAMQSSSKAFGLIGKDPKNFSATPEELRAAFFRKHPLVGVVPDYAAIIAEYREFARPLHERWKSKSQGDGLSGRAALELLLVFLQDFPYGRPGQVVDSRLIADLLVPPQVFLNGWGDCDSKSLVMASVLSFEPEYDGKMAMILVPGHALLGLEIEPRAYDEFYEYRNRKYVVAEPTGLGRTPLGRKNSPYTTILAVDPLPAIASLKEKRREENSNFVDFSRPKEGVITSAPPVTATNEALRALTRADCSPRGVLTDTVSPYSKIRVQSCYISQGKEILKDGPEVEFDREGRPSVRRVYRRGQLLR